MTAAFTLCDAVICNDSGPMHMANATGVPVVALFGPGKLEWFGPRGGASHIVRVEDMPCRPCFDICKFAEAYCMTRISETDVVEATVDLLAGRNRGASHTTRSAGAAPHRSMADAIVS
jgi:heptosyltransferase-2